ncbi:ABC transporter substrate-binding protein [Vibrio variabilis]|uniref:ABC transporter substrate-binding protein n=1 Tax=Vibrio variabilis TaxID=990271 RepID=UPI000DD847DF|nr:spermidine/putrescine ABC transporter substrate-binding protein [Vibrio variabilis]
MILSTCYRYFLGSTIGMLLLSGGPVASASDKASTVHLYNWEAFLSEEVVRNIETEHHLHIKETYFSDESVRDELLLSKRRNSIDLVVIESVRLNMLANQGVMQPLTEIRAELKSRFDNRWFEQCGDYGVPYAWGTSGLLYRKSAFEKPVDTWLQLIEPQEQLRGRVSMYYHPVDLIGAALLAHNKDPFSDDNYDLKLAYQALKKQRPYLNSTDYVLDAVDDASLLESTDLAFGFSGDEYVLNEFNTNPDGEWQYVVPKEGTFVWVECLAVPSGIITKPQTKQAIDYLTRPDVAAKNAQDAWFSTPNSNIERYLDKEYLSDPVINPSPELIEKSYAYREVGDYGLSIRQRIVKDLK